MVFLNVASLLVLNFAICLHAKLSFLVSFLLLHIKKELPLLSLLEDVKPKLNSDTNGRENRSLSKSHLCFQGLAVCLGAFYTLPKSQRINCFCFLSLSRRDRKHYFFFCFTSSPCIFHKSCISGRGTSCFGHMKQCKRSVTLPTASAEHLGPWRGRGEGWSKR